MYVELLQRSSGGNLWPQQGDRHIHMKGAQSACSANARTHAHRLLCMLSSCARSHLGMAITVHSNVPSHRRHRPLSGAAAAAPAEPQPLRLCAPSGLSRAQLLVAAHAMRLPALPSYCGEHGGVVRPPFHSAFLPLNDAAQHTNRDIGTPPPAHTYTYTQLQPCRPPGPPSAPTTNTNTKITATARLLTVCCCNREGSTGGLP
jgi:hypothetical protein